MPFFKSFVETAATCSPLPPVGPVHSTPSAGSPLTGGPTRAYCGAVRPLVLLESGLDDERRALLLRSWAEAASLVASATVPLTWLQAEPRPVGFDCWYNHDPTGTCSIVLRTEHLLPGADVRAELPAPRFVLRDGLPISPTPTPRRAFGRSRRRAATVTTHPQWLPGTSDLTGIIVHELAHGEQYEVNALVPGARERLLQAVRHAAGARNVPSSSTTGFDPALREAVAAELGTYAAKAGMADPWPELWSVATTVGLCTSRADGPIVAAVREIRHELAQVPTDARLQHTYGHLRRAMPVDQKEQLARTRYDLYVVAEALAPTCTPARLRDLIAQARDRGVALDLAYLSTTTAGKEALPARFAAPSRPAARPRPSPPNGHSSLG